MREKKSLILKIGFLAIGIFAFLIGFYTVGLFFKPESLNALTEMATTKTLIPDTKKALESSPLSELKKPSPSETNDSGVGDEPLNLSEINESDLNITFESNLDFKYDPIGKRDPFRPFRNSKIGVGQLNGRIRNPEPLENFDIKSLQVVAIIWGNKKPRALISDPNSNIHSVVKGQRIGRNDGYVAEIREGEIVIVELFDQNGKTIKEPVILPIKK